jgi:hypothetical protein
MALDIKSSEADALLSKATKAAVKKSGSKFFNGRTEEGPRQRSPCSEQEIVATSQNLGICPLWYVSRDWYVGE